MDVLRNESITRRYLGRISDADLLTTALIDTKNLRGFFQTVISMLEPGIGTLDAGLWLPDNPSPSLMIHDEQLPRWCADLLAAPGAYDRVIQEAGSSKTGSEAVLRMIH